MDFLKESIWTENRSWAALAVISLLAVGLVNVVQLLFWGVEPLWGFVIVLPVAFFVVLGWIAFRNGAAQEVGELCRSGHS